MVHHSVGGAEVARYLFTAIWRIVSRMPSRWTFLASAGHLPHIFLSETLYLVSLRSVGFDELASGSRTRLSPKWPPELGHPKGAS